MSKTLLAAVLLLLGSITFARCAPADLSWSDLKAQGKLKTGEIVTRDGEQVLKLSNPNNKQARFAILTIDKPEVTGDSYSFAGQVAYENVEGKGYIEMLSYFPAPLNGPFFSRTLGESPMQPIQGSSPARQFVAPFFMKPSDPKPVKVELNVVLPGRGIVYLGPTRFYGDWSLKTAYSALGLAVPWWYGSTAGLVGGLAGAFFGVTQSLLALLTIPGKARKFVMAAMVTTIVFGAALFIAGLVAVAVHQPYWVYYPLLLLGALILLIVPYRTKWAKKHYDEIELRRMSAQDAIPHNC